MTREQSIHKLLAAAHNSYYSLVESTQGYQIGLMRTDSGLIDYGLHTYPSLHDIAIHYAVDYGIEPYSANSDRFKSVRQLCREVRTAIANGAQRLYG